jgi:hypothetical protein
MHGFEGSLQWVLVSIPGPGLSWGAKGVTAVALETVPESHTETQPA